MSQDSTDWSNRLILISLSKSGISKSSSTKIQIEILKLAVRESPLGVIAESTSSSVYVHLRIPSEPWFENDLIK